MMTDRIKTKI